MNYYEIGQKIKKFRKINGISQEELAEKIGISTTHMSHIETGSTKLSLAVLVSIANALDVRTDDLLNLNINSNSSLSELSEILEGCSNEHLKIITDIVKTTKTSLEKYGK